MHRRSGLCLSVIALCLGGCAAPKPVSEVPASAAAVASEPKSGDEVPESRYLVVDQFGYRPELAKIAILVDPVVGWNAADEYQPGEVLEIRRYHDGKKVMSGAPVAWQSGQVQPNAGDRGWWFDFSEVREPGSYFVFDPKNRVRSYRFEIGQGVYREVLKAAVRMFYFNRANVKKEKPYACVGQKCWLAERDTMGPGQDGEARSVRERDNPKTARDLSGGWWDAGDTNKYTTFTYPVLHQLLTAFTQNPKPFTDDYNIPESGNGLPDLIDELKVELDFLKKMQASDLGGGALLKMGNVEYGDPIPELSTFPRYYYPEPCSSATITIAGMFAHAALVLRQFATLGDYARDLEARAKSAWEHYQTHPKSDICDDGTIKSGDADVSLPEQDARAVVAAVYLFALTGEPRYTEFMKKHRGLTRPFKEDRFGIYEAPESDAFLYYTTLANADPEFRRDILERKLSGWRVADYYGMKPEKDLYRAYMREDSYHWGSNNPRANFGSTNHDLVQYGLVQGPELVSARDRAAGMLHSFHGVNPMQLVYLSQMEAYGAERSATEIYHTWFRDGDPRYDSSKTSSLGPAPGYVTGGPNKTYCENDKDHGCYGSEFRKQPAQKAYIDFNTSWEPKAPYDMSWALTEPAIYYQAAYIKLLSKFVD